MVDGFEYTQVTPTPTILDNLIHEEKIRPVIGVFIGNASPNSRDNELTGNHDFMKFVLDEVLPFVKKDYSITNEAKDRIIGGASFGGLCAAFIAYHHPLVFGNVLLQSGAFWYTENFDVIKQYESVKPLHLQFYLDVGKLEDQESMVDKNRYFKEILKSRGYKVFYDEFIGGHDHLCWRGTLANALIALIGKN